MQWKSPVVLLSFLLLAGPNTFASTIIDTNIPRLPQSYTCPIEASAVQAVVVTNAYIRFSSTDSDYQSLDGHLTTHGAHPYTHDHALKDFTCQGTTSDGATVSLTKFGVGGFYLCYWGLDPNIVVLSPASMAQNCHGYTTGLGSWIGTGITGIVTVVGDDYAPSTMAPNNKYAFSEASGFPNMNHSFKIDYSCVTSGGITICYPTSISEKANVSPIIRRASSTVPGTYTKHIRVP